MKQNFFKYIFILVIIALIGGAIYFIYSNQQNRVEGAKEENKTNEIQMIDNMRLGVSGYDTMNPLISNNKAILEISKLLFEPLLTITQDYKVELDLAKEWSKTSDTTYIIKLKEDLKWQDGSKITAEDVRFTIDRLKENKSVYSYNVAQVVGVESLDNVTIKITLQKEVPFFEYNLTFPIMSKEYYSGEDFFTSTKIPVVSGKYRIESIDEKNVILVPNQNWWKKEQETLKLNKIIINRYESVGEMYKNFKIGNIDLIASNNPNLEEYIGTIGFNTKQYLGRQQDFLAINCENAILSKVEVRQAIKQSIDKTNIVASVYRSNYEVSDFPLDYGSYTYTKVEDKFKYDATAANKTLTDNGWEYKNKVWQKKENYKTLKLDFDLIVQSSNENRVRVAEIIKSQLEQVGIKITIKKVNDSQYQKYLENKNYELILTGNYNSLSPDLTTYLGEENLANYQNESSRGLVKELNNLTDEKLIKEKIQKLNEIYQEQVPYISLYRAKETVAYSQKLMGDMKPNFYSLFYNISGWYRQ